MIEGFDKLPVLTKDKSTSPALTAEQTDIIEAAGLPWQDSYKRDADGHLLAKTDFTCE